MCSAFAIFWYACATYAPDKHALCAVYREAIAEQLLREQAAPLCDGKAPYPGRSQSVHP